MKSEPVNPTGRARDLARILDSAFRVPGTRFRFGLDPILGLVPGLGDAVGGAFGFYVLVAAYRAGAPPIVLLRMFGNIGVDLLFGAIPVLGDLFDAAYKANLRNLGLLERYVARPEETTRASAVLLVTLLILLVAILAAGAWLAVNAVQALLGTGN